MQFAIRELCHPVAAIRSSFMRSTSNIIHQSAFTFLFLLMLLPLGSAWAQTACASLPPYGSCQCPCGGLSSLPPQNPSSRSYDDFVIQAYRGAYGRLATCDERQAEDWKLVDESYNGSLLVEAKRFDTILLEMQMSYDFPDNDTKYF